MTDHEWADTGRDPFPGRRERCFKCSRCGSVLESRERPEADPYSPFTAVLTSSAWSPSGIRSDCDSVILTKVMET